MIEQIKFNPQLKIENLDQLPRGRGLKYLECVKHDDEKGTTLIAHSWRRKLPVGIPPWHVVVNFSA